MTVKHDFISENQVLGNVQHKVALPALIGSTGVTADNFGRKVIPAGTVVGGSASFLDDSQAVLSAGQDANAQGVLEHDVDVTSGNATGTVIIFGFVNTARIPNVTVSNAAKKSLAGKVTFFNRQQEDKKR